MTHARAHTHRETDPSRAGAHKRMKLIIKQESRVTPAGIAITSHPLLASAAWLVVRKPYPPIAALLFLLPSVLEGCCGAVTLQGSEALS